ncbi:MAG: permease [Planctomycetes bacterium]|nr:permease [Planctomycetota bacterium]
MLEGVSLGRRRALVLAGIFILITALAALFYYKWTGSWRTVGAAGASGWTMSPDAITTGGMLRTTLNYFGRVWIALVFGILIGAVVRALISPRWVASLLGYGGAVRRAAVGGFAGAPLMLCSCCVTPIFTGIYERGARLGGALTLMLASPGLNLAALLLTFMLFPPTLSLARLGASIVAVFLLPILIERLFGGHLKPPRSPAPDEDPGPLGFGDFAWRFVRSVAYLSAITLPLIAAGVLLSSLILPLGLSPSAAGLPLSVIVVSAIGVLVALPTFFEIPLAILLIQMGAPGAAAAMLFAGPIVNLPSLFVLARETNAKVAGALAAGIWLLGIAAGAVVM